MLLILAYFDVYVPSALGSTLYSAVSYVAMHLVNVGQPPPATAVDAVCMVALSVPEIDQISPANCFFPAPDACTLQRCGTDQSGGTRPAV